MSRFYAYALIALSFSIAIAPSAFLAHAEGQVAIGNPNKCTFGLDADFVQVGRTMHGPICMSPAEAERGVYLIGPEKNQLMCRVLIVRAK